MRHIIYSNYIFRQYCSFWWDVDIYKLLNWRCLAVSLGFLARRQDMCPCCLILFPTVLVETLTFVCQWLWRVLDAAYLCWWASRTSALSSRPVVARLLPERGRSFTSPGFYLYLLSILYTVLCDICIARAMCDTVVPTASIPMTYQRWLMVLFPMTKSNWPVSKSWLLGWPKLCWFQLYCSKTLWSISLIFARHITRYIHIILTIFQEATQCLTLWKISLENFCKNFFPGVYVCIRPNK